MSDRKVAVVTGATSGLGEAAALALSKEGFRVMVVGRDAERGEAVAKAADGEFIAADLFTVAGVHALVNQIQRRTSKVSVVINNAGGTFGKKELTVDGLERTFALNVMAPYLLTEGLIEELSAANGRVVNLVTGIPDGAKATIDQLVGDGADAGIGSYTRNKLALASLTGEQQRRYRARGVTVVSLHPGIIPGTRFGADAMPAFLRAIGGFAAKLFRFGSTLDEAAARYVKLATEDVEPGAFYGKGVLAEPPKQAKDEAFAKELWTTLSRLAPA